MEKSVLQARREPLATSSGLRLTAERCLAWLGLLKLARDSMDVVRRTPGAVACRIRDLIREKRARAQARRALESEARRALESEVAFFSTFISPGDLVFDVGANRGLKTRAFVALGTSVVAFEPQPDCVAMLREEFGGNPRVEVVPVGLASAPGELRMNVCATHDDLSTFSEDCRANNPRLRTDIAWECVTLPVITLRDAISRWGEPSFIKIDVEGYEFDVISTLTRPSGTLSFEFWEERSQRAIDILHRLRAIGYERFNLTTGNPPVWQLPGFSDMDDVVASLEALPAKCVGDIYAMPPAP